VDGAYSGEVRPGDTENGWHRIAHDRISTAFPDRRLHEHAALYVRNGRGMASDENDA